MADAAGETPLSLARASLARGDEGATAVMRELRWPPAVRLMWLGAHAAACASSPPPCSGSASGSEVAAPCLMQSLTRDVVRLVADAVVAAHAPPRAIDKSDAPPRPEAGVAEAMSLAEMALAVRTIHESPFHPS